MTAFVDEIRPPEVELGDDEERLLRQITVDHWNEQQRIPSSMAFGPASIDNLMASHTRESVVSAQESRDWFNENLPKKSYGVWAFTVRHAIDQGLRSVDDSDTPLAPGQLRPPGHCYVDYRHLTKSERRATRSALLRIALELGEIPTVGELG